MRNVLQIYKDVLRELDKYNSPSFEIEDFNYFFNKARLERCNIRYQLFDTKQQLTDDLRSLVVHKIYTKQEMVNNYGLLPSDYFHTLGTKVTFGYKLTEGCNIGGSTFSKACKRLTADNSGFILGRKFYEPSPKRPYYKLEGDSILIERGFDLNLEIVSLDLEYLKYPKQIKLNPDFTSTPVNDTSEFSDYVDNEDIKICVSLFLENVEQRRSQSFPAISKTVN